MKTLGNHDVKIFTDNIETTAIEQIERLHPAEYARRFFDLHRQRQ